MKKVIFIFPRQPFEKSVDENFNDEWTILYNFDCERFLFDFDEFVNGDESSLNRLPIVDVDNITFYRGWMFTDEQYKLFYDILTKMGYNLVNRPEQYNTVHYSPLAYGKSSCYQSNGPEMMIFEGKDYSASAVSQYFYRKNIESVKYIDKIIVKDWVKSAKGVENALIINDVKNVKEIQTVTDNMIKVREMYGFNKGIVFKEYIEPRLSPHSGQNIEFRAFVLNNKVISVAANYDVGTESLLLDIDNNLFESIAKELNVPFLTIDIMLDKECKNWNIIETGAGEVSGLAASDNPLSFYNNLFLNIHGILNNE